MKELAQLAIKVNALASELGAVRAEGTNKSSHYDYIGYEQINAKLRNLLPKHKIAIIPECTGLTEKATELVSEYNGNKKTQQVIRSTVSMKMHVVDLETGFEQVYDWYGADQDYGGKSAGQALTEAVKRFELKLFHISTKADVDADSKTTTVQETTKDPLSWIMQFADVVDTLKVKQVSRDAVIKLVNEHNYNINSIRKELGI